MMIQPHTPKNSGNTALFLMDTKSNKCCYLTSSDIDNMILGAHPISLDMNATKELFDHNTLIQISDALKGDVPADGIECTQSLPEHIMCSFIN